MFTLYVDGARWRAHQQQVAAARPGIVPVAKGNGYGFGVDRLAMQSTALGVDTMAVGTYSEVADTTLFSGSVLVLSPWRPASEEAGSDTRVVHTISRLADLEDLLERQDQPRVVLEHITSMRRHGMSTAELHTALRRIDGARLEGFALHLPLAGHGQLDETRHLMRVLTDLHPPVQRVYVSHLDEQAMSAVTTEFPGFQVRPRIGTDLWLGDPGAFAARATVLDAHPVRRGDVFGYRGRHAPATGTILVVSGGTSHGIGLESPSSGASWRDRAITVARGGLDAAGFVRSPYTVSGKRRMFAEPPHMQASMLWLPQGARVPDVGEEVDVRVRLTATTFDRTVVS